MSGRLATTLAALVAIAAACPPAARASESLPAAIDPAAPTREGHLACGGATLTARTHMLGRTSPNRLARHRTSRPGTRSTRI